MISSASIVEFERSIAGQHLLLQAEFSNVPSSNPRRSSLVVDSLEKYSDLDKLKLPSIDGISARGSRSCSMTSMASKEDDKVRAASFTSSGDESGLGSRTGSVSHQKDSGIESSDQVDFLGVPVETMNKIVSIVEWYFSDENLSKDSFLLKHISRNREGYVSLKLVSSLRKVKSVTKDWKTVAASIRKVSKKLIMNDEVTKIKRIDPLPISMVKKCGHPSVTKYQTSKLMIVSNISADKPLASLTNTFSTYGDISFIRIYRDKSVPPNTGHLLNFDGHRHSVDGSNNNKSIVAIIQYENHESAEKAVKGINEHSNNNWRSTMKADILANQATFELKTKKLVKKSGSVKPNPSKNHDQQNGQGWQHPEVVKSQRPFCRNFLPKNNSEQNQSNATRQPIGPDPSGFKGFKRNLN